MYSPSHQEGCTSLLSRRIKCYNTTPSRTKNTSQKANKNDHKDHTLVWLNEATEPRHACRANHSGQVMADSSDKTQPTGGGSSRLLRCSCFENPGSSMKRHKDMTQEDEHPRLAGVQYATGEEQRNSSRKDEEAQPKQKWHLVVDVFGGESKVWCCKE